jgi:hypothetical protein
MYAAEMTNGFLNIKSLKNNTYLHSKGGPYREIRLKLDAVKAAEGDFLVIFGAGAGYVIREAYDLRGIRDFLVIEPSAEISEIAGNEGALSAIESTDLTVYALNQVNWKKEILENVILMKAGCPIKIYESAYFKMLAPAFLNEACAGLTGAIRRVSGIMSGLEKNGFFHENKTDIERMMLKEILFSFDRSEAGM